MTLQSEPETNLQWSSIRRLVERLETLDRASMCFGVRAEGAPVANAISILRSKLLRKLHAAIAEVAGESIEGSVAQDGDVAALLESLHLVEVNSYIDSKVRGH